MPLNDPRRVLPLEGTLNFRDLGGYPAADGRTTAWGQIYRADAVSLLTQDGWRSLSELGVKRIYDLRRQSERDASPTVEHGLAHEVVHLSIGPAFVEIPMLEFFAQRGVSAEPLDENYMAGMYRELLTDFSDVFAQLFTNLGDGHHRPAVFHCTAGKDRTGLAAALLLGTLGVDDELILDDYELTNTTRSNIRIRELTPELEKAGINVESVRPYLSAPRSAMAQTLQWLAETHDGPEGFLRASGVSDGTIASLRAELLTDDAA